MVETHSQRCWRLIGQLCIELKKDLLMVQHLNTGEEVDLVEYPLQSNNLLS